MKHEDIDDSLLGSTMCLPWCSNRTYRSTIAHVALILTSACSVASLGSCAITLTLSQLFSEKQAELMAERSLYLGGIGLGLAAASAILFFAGTKKNNDEEKRLVPSLPV